MDSLSVVVFHVVINAGLCMELSVDSVLPLPNVSKTAPLSMSSWGVVRLATAVRCGAVSVTITREPNTDTTSPAPSVTPPVELPGFRICILGFCIVELRFSSNFIIIRPSHAEYVTDRNVGLVVSATIMVLLLDCVMPLPAASNTAFDSMSSWGVLMPDMRDDMVELNCAVMVEPDGVTDVDAFNDMPPVVWLVSRM